MTTLAAHPDPRPAGAATFPPEGPAAAFVVATFNRKDYLLQALESILAQDFAGRWEVVIVDDGSTDGTPAALAPYLERHGDPQGRCVVRLLHQTNGGPGPARNRGIAASSAPLIAFLDDDDLCEPTRLTQQVAAFRADPAVGFCHSSYRYINSQGGLLDGRPQRLDNPCVGACLDALLSELMVITSTVMVRRDILMQAAAIEPHGLPYNPRWPQAEDYDLALRMARLAPFAYVPQPLVRYRFHEGNIAMRPANIRKAFRYHCQVQFDFAQRHPDALAPGSPGAQERVRTFLRRRVEANFWQRRFFVVRELCGLAREFSVFDESFARVERRLRIPLWVYRGKDWVDHKLHRHRQTQTAAPEAAEIPGVPGTPGVAEGTGLPASGPGRRGGGRSSSGTLA